MSEEIEKQLVEKINTVGRMMDEQPSRVPYEVDGLLEVAKSYIFSEREIRKSFEEGFLKQDKILRAQSYELERLKRDYGGSIGAQDKLKKISELLNVQGAAPPQAPPAQKAPQVDDSQARLKEAERAFEDYSKQHGEYHEKIQKIQDEDIEEKLVSKFEGHEGTDQADIKKKIKDALGVTGYHARKLFRKFWKKDKKNGKKIYKFEAME